MPREAVMVNLMFEDRMIFAVVVPEWSTQHELNINSSNSWIKYPSPEGWHWLRLPLPENYAILGLTTPTGFVTPEGKKLTGEDLIINTVYRSHIITHARQFGVHYKDSDVYLILQMFFKRM